VNNHRFDTLSADQRERVHSALTAAFGSTPIDAIAPISGGASSASTFRIEVGGKAYLLRVEGRPSPLRNPHQYASMRIAGEAGIAPKIHYIDETARVAVIDFIGQQPLNSYPGGPHALAQALGKLLSRVQATPAFPAFVNYPDIVARLFAHVRRTGLFGRACLIHTSSALSNSAKLMTRVWRGLSPATTIPSRATSFSMANGFG